jgi:hypothetical protein
VLEYLTGFLVSTVDYVKPSNVPESDAFDATSLDNVVVMGLTGIRERERVK